MTDFERGPKTAKGKRILAARGPNLFEDDKVSMFLKGKNCSNEVSKLLADLSSLKKPLVVARKRDCNFYPFLDTAHIEKMANTAHCNLVVLGESSKKRKACLVFMRMFNEQLLDAVELVVSNYQPASSFKGVPACSVGAKPLLVFQGAGFSSTETQLSRTKNVFVDLFKNADPKAVSLEGIEHTIVITETSTGKLLFRVYRMEKKKGDTPNVPKIELTEMGPSFDFTLGRERLPDFTLWKASMKKPITTSTTSTTKEDATKKKKKNKNISTNALGQTIGRIHLGRQDYTKLNTPHRALQNPKKKSTSSETEQPSIKKSRS